MKRLSRLLPIAAALAALPGAARACSIRPADPPLTQDQIDDLTRRGYADAEALIEIQTLAPSGRGRPFQVRVLRVYKGDIAPGALLAFRLPDFPCGGAPAFARGARGLVLIGRVSDPVWFSGFLPLETFALLHRSGLIPPPRGR